MSAYLDDYYDKATSVRELQTFANFWNAKIQEWKAEGRTEVEKQHAQQLWSGFLSAFGIDPTRINLFERNATRASTGRHGYIDFFMTGVVIGEAKSLGKDLEKAAEQADDYLNGGSIRNTEMPQWSIMTNFEYFRFTRLSDGHQFTLHITELPDNWDHLTFIMGKEPVTKTEQEVASIHAARLMASLYTSILGDDADEVVGQDAPQDPEEEDAKVQKTSILMTRLLFLLYGDDAGLWKADLFHSWVEFETTPSTLGGQIVQLFQVLNTPVDRRPRAIPETLAKFPYVNGAIFADTLDAEFFTPETREALLEACRFKWNRISVSVFGSLFQMVKSKEARHAAGEHYTTEKNILKTIGPLFLDQYRAEADRLIRNTTTKDADFTKFLKELASNIYCDPACGSGNFLNLAYAKLREIETDILTEKYRRRGKTDRSLDISLDQVISINQFYGFEINWWPAKIAETAMFLVDHQANLKLRELGDPPNRLPINITAHIIHANALELNWEEALPEPQGQTFIFGNPPFLGQSKKTETQTKEMQEAWGTQYDGYLDYVTAWFKKSADLLHNRHGEFAFVATNSIAQGQPVGALFKMLFNNGWVVKFAHRTFAWESEAPGEAVVYCSIVGVTRDMTHKPQLWDYPDVKGEPVSVPVKTKINAYLAPSDAGIIPKSTKPISPEILPMKYGYKPADGGNLVPKSNVPLPEHDPTAMKYVRRFIGAKEALSGTYRWCLWMADDDFDPSDIRKSPVLSQRVKATKEFRENQPTTGDAYKLKDTPHLFRLTKNVISSDYLCIPIHVSHTRRYYTVQQFGPEIICGNANFQIQDPTGLQFSLISSTMFITWQRAIGGRIKEDYRFANTLTWNTFPVPALTEKQRKAIIAAGKKVLEARELHPERSLEEHYEPLAMAPELIKAHNALDKAVDAAFGETRRMTVDAKRLEVLFEHYKKLTAS